MIKVRASMTDLTNILNAATQGDPTAAEELLPLVYDELRKLAAAKVERELPGPFPANSGRCQRQR